MTQSRFTPASAPRTEAWASIADDVSIPITDRPVAVNLG
jgi:hypothetical protein